MPLIGGRMLRAAKLRTVMKNKTTNANTEAFHVPINRRCFFRSMAAVSAGFTLSGYLAEALTLSPAVTQGPYYPLANNIPLDKDNDLVQLNDNLTIAAGIVTYLSGRASSIAAEIRFEARWSSFGTRIGKAITSIRQTGSQSGVRCELRGFRPVPYWVERAILVPHGQSGPLCGTHAALSCRRHDSGAAHAFDDADFLEWNSDRFERRCVGDAEQQ